VSPKQTIAHYRVTSKLGEGGMGEVWRATDTKLDRDVAIKILPAAFAADAGRMARFEREAKVLASLNHPNIAAIYGVEEQALVMELVEGESPKGPMPFEDAWKIALQIADALEYAHDRGVIHRDLKPANVKVTPDGVVKLLDFGLAKAYSETPDTASLDPENSPTITLGATVAGTVMGTAAYMAPEQAKGKRVDKRADIWSWGVMLYELLTGERLFKGDEALTKLENGELTHRWPQILPGRNAILFSASSSPGNWEEAHVEVLSLKTGKRKTVVRSGFYGRYLPSGHLVYLRAGTLYGMAFDIDRLEPAGPSATLLEGIAASTYGGGQFDFSRNGTLVYLTPNPSIEGRRKLVWIDAAGKTQPFFAAPARFNGPALSPDGKRLAVSIEAVGGSDLWVYDLEREIPTKLPTGGQVLLGPLWAPDGKHLVYGTLVSSNSGVMWVRADGGGEPQLLIPDDTHRGKVPVSVSPDGRFVLLGAPGGVGKSVTIDTADPDHPKTGVITTEISSSIRGGTISPDGRWLAYTSDDSGTGQVFVRPFANGKIAGGGVWPISAAGGGYPVWSRAEHQPRQLLYVASEGRIMVVDYTVEGDSFHNSKPRLRTDKQIGTTPPRLGGAFSAFDLTADGTRIIAWQPQEQPKEAKVDLHVTMLLNWFDELRRRLPPSGK
jgi:WD40 repeat protein